MFTEDLDIFLNADEFASACVIVETQEIISGIFHRPYSDALDVQGFTPSLMCKTSDVTERGLSRGSKIEIPNVAIFRVVTFEPDGTGITRIILETTE